MLYKIKGVKYTFTNNELIPFAEYERTCNNYAEARKEELSLKAEGWKTSLETMNEESDEVPQ